MRFPPFLNRVRGLRALDLLNLFIADAQTGFGAFLAVYLASHKWTALQIGAVLSIGTVATIASQIPAGALVDAMRSKRRALAGGIGAITVAALLLALLPYQLPVAVAELLHGFASCVLTPAVAAVSLRLVGHAGFPERLGRNARFAAIGNATAAAAMGAIGTYISPRSVFLLTAALALPALFMLHRVGAAPAPALVHAATRTAPRRFSWQDVQRLLMDRRLLAFGACVVLFHMANAALLPIAAGVITARVGAYASLIIAACIVVPQCVVALLSPMVGRRAMLWGRRAVLLIGWTAIPVRAALLAILPAPALIVAAQALDGISAAVFGVMLPLIAADLTRGRGRFNLCVGIFGLATGIGATISTSLAGWIADAMGEQVAFAALAGIGMAGVAFLALAMPETAPDKPAAAPKPAVPRTPVLMLVSARPAQRMEARRPGLRAERRRGYARVVRGGLEWR
ncbi:MAG TPA: MFS transporter [Acetobacteraceae bacterium]|nr:MFS transporter [Acetobacteraceae bacterium]